MLRAIAAQPADPQPVFDLIAQRVRELAGATTASILEYDGTLLHRTADAGYPPDVLVTVPSDACRTMDFHLAADMIQLGRDLAIEALDATANNGSAHGPASPAAG